MLAAVPFLYAVKLLAISCEDPIFDNEAHIEPQGGTLFAVVKGSPKVSTVYEHMFSDVLGFRLHARFPRLRNAWHSSVDSAG